MRAFLIFVLFISVFGIAGHLDFQDEQAEQRMYCEMVKNGSWPDYEKSYDLWCKQ